MLKKNPSLFLFLFAIIFTNSFINFHYVFSDSAANDWGERCRHNVDQTGMSTGCWFLYALNTGTYEGDCTYCTVHAEILTAGISGESICVPGLTSHTSDCYTCSASGSSVLVAGNHNSWDSDSENCGELGVPCCLTGSSFQDTRKVGASDQDSGTDCWAPPGTSDCRNCL